jgi:hypothetical protein
MDALVGPVAVDMLPGGSLQTAVTIMRIYRSKYSASPSHCAGGEAVDAFWTSGAIGYGKSVLYYRKIPKSTRNPAVCGPGYVVLKRWLHSGV